MKRNKNHDHDLTAVILAGGMGSRLRPVITDRQKVMAEVHGRPFITFILDQLHEAGFKQIVLCTGYLGDKMEKMLGAEYKGITLSYSREHTPLGTGGALRQALPMILSDPVLVMNGDSFYDANILTFLDHHKEKKAVFSMMLSYVSDSSRYGQVALGGHDKIMRFNEKGEGPESGWINAGIYLLNKILISGLPEGKQISLEREVFPGWLSQNCYGYKINGCFLDIGTPESYQHAELLIST